MTIKTKSAVAALVWLLAAAYAILISVVYFPPSSWDFDWRTVTSVAAGIAALVSAWNFGDEGDLGGRWGHVAFTLMLSGLVVHWDGLLSYGNAIAISCGLVGWIALWVWKML